VTKFS